MNGGQRVLVAGGNGFLGSHLCDRLADRGDEVVSVDNLSTGTVANVAHLLDHSCQVEGVDVRREGQRQLSFGHRPMGQQEQDAVQQVWVLFDEADGFL